MSNNITLENILKKEKISGSERILLVLKLSIPAILAQLTSIAMQYIDAAMVGNMGAGPMASIGLVSTSTWLIGGMCIGMSAGFSVQVAQLIGGSRDQAARNVFRQGIIIMLSCGLVLSLFSISISQFLPGWLGGAPEILEDSSKYFFIYSCTIIFNVIRQYSCSMLQCTGDMKTPSFLSGLVCILDVIFNMLLIFPTRYVSLGTLRIFVPGANLGVSGAALGTSLAEIIIAFSSAFMVCCKSKKLALSLPGGWKIKRDTLINAVKIAVPMTVDHVFMCSAYLVSTLIVAPLGTISVAANSLSITAESLCYMPGYGVGSAATVIVGHTIGAKRTDLTKAFSNLSVLIGVVFMSITAVFMFFLSPSIFGFLTSDADVAALGVAVLRIELFAEPFYAMAICCNGVFRGAGDTLIPGIINLCSMWGVRIVLSLFLVPMYGLRGYWIAMSVELFVRGMVFFIRMKNGKWMNKAVI